MGSWKLGQVAGIDISLHWTLLLLIALVGLTSPAGSALVQVALMAAIFGCVLLHELGHALAARQFGIPTRGITLMMLGGIAQLERMPRRPLQELWIAVAGPLVNVVIALAVFVLIGPLGTLTSAGVLPVKLAMGAQYLMLANVSLVVFNMLPAFPMDGGRVLRALLALRWSYPRATQAAATVGKYLAILMGVVGLVKGPFLLVLVAGFIFLAGSAEARMVASEYHPKFEPPPRGTSPDARRWPASNGTVVVWDPSEQRYRVVGWE